MKLIGPVEQGHCILKICVCQCSIIVETKVNQWMHKTNTHQNFQNYFEDLLE